MKMQKILSFHRKHKMWNSWREKQHVRSLVIKINFLLLFFPNWKWPEDQILTKLLQYSALAQVWPNLGIFKVLRDNFSYKSSPNVCLLFGLFWKYPYINCYGYFLANFWKILGYLYFSVWSHCLRSRTSVRN